MNDLKTPLMVAGILIGIVMGVYAMVISIGYVGLYYTEHITLKMVELDNKIQNIERGRK